MAGSSSSTFGSSGASLNSSSIRLFGVEEGTGEIGSKPVKTGFDPADGFTAATGLDDVELLLSVVDEADELDWSLVDAVTLIENVGSGSFSCLIAVLIALFRLSTFCFSTFGTS